MRPVQPATTWGPYVVRVDPTNESHAIITRADDMPPDPSWQELQHMKTLAFGSHARAVELYPETTKIIDTANMRHLWRLPDSLRSPCIVSGFREWEWLK